MDIVLTDDPLPTTAATDEPVGSEAALASIVGWSAIAPLGKEMHSAAFAEPKS